MSEQEKPNLLLKWGTIKGWSGMNESQVAILQRWADEGRSMSVAMQRDSQTQKQAICDLIDTMEDGRICCDWDGAIMTREEATKYVLEYRR
jgi:hypothetical protein